MNAIQTLQIASLALAIILIMVECQIVSLIRKTAGYDGIVEYLIRRDRDRQKGYDDLLEYIVQQNKERRERQGQSGEGTPPDDEKGAEPA